MQSDNLQELLPVVNAEGNTIGSARRSECHSGKMILHPVVHLHLFNTAGELYLQLRPKWKTIQPNKWDTAVGGHISYGESVESALRRETMEELGIENLNSKKVLEYQFTSEIETEFVHSYVAITDRQVHPSEETAGGRFWSIPEIENNLGNGVFTPNFEDEFMLLKKHGVISNLK